MCECFDCDIMCDVVWFVVVLLLLWLCASFACVRVVRVDAFVCCYMACFCFVLNCG